MLRKLKFFAIGLIPGIMFMLFFLNMKGASCSGYLPNSRVVAETLSTKFVYSPQVTAQMATHHISEKFLRDSIITPGKIDFDKSQAQRKPCPTYLLQSSNQKYQLVFEKCETVATMQELKVIR